MLHVLTYARYIVLPIAPNVFRLEHPVLRIAESSGFRPSSARDDRDDRDRCPRSCVCVCVLVDVLRVVPARMPSHHRYPSLSDDDDDDDDDHG